MKTRTHLLLVSGLMTLAAGAQTVPVTVTNAEGQVVNGTTITINGDVPVGQAMGMGLSAENTSGMFREVNVKRYELDVAHGTKNYFCWDLCYGEQLAGVWPLWVGADPISMDAGEVANGFHAYYMPEGFTGTATFRYVWYDTSSENDSTWVDFVFNSGEGAGVAEVAAVRSFSVYPNPAVDGNITVSYDLSSAFASDRLAVYNLLGERKLVRNLSGVQGRTMIGELEAGVWFAVLERNGKAMATKRVVVVR